MQLLSKIGKTEPQYALSCFIGGWKQTKLFWEKNDNHSKLIKKLDDIATKQFITITGGINCSDVAKRLLSLPLRMGGLEMLIFSEIANFEYVNLRNWNT